MPMRGGAIHDAKAPGSCTGRIRPSTNRLSSADGSIVSLRACHCSPVSTLPSVSAWIAANSPMRRLNATCGRVMRNSNPGPLDHPVPARHAGAGILHIVVAQPHVQRRQRRHVLLHDRAVAQPQHRIGRAGQQVIVGQPVLAIASLQAGVERVRGIGADLVAEQIERQREMQIGLLLQRRQIDHAERAHPLDIRRIVDAGVAHRLAGALNDALHAGLADEHVVRFLGQHEAAGARQRIEARLRQRRQLHLAVAVGEEREHEERQPVRRRLVERAQHARTVLIAGTAAQQFLRLLAPVAAEVFLQQIDHGPEMAAFLDIHLEQVAQVVERRRGAPRDGAAARPWPVRYRPG